MILILKEIAFLTHEVHSSDQTRSAITTAVKLKTKSNNFLIKSDMVLKNINMIETNIILQSNNIL